MPYISPRKQKLLLSSFNFLGDNVMLTPIIKSLKQQYGNRFDIGVFSPTFQEVFKNNPNIDSSITQFNKDIFIRGLNYYNKHDYFADYGHSVFGFKKNLQAKLGLQLYIKDMNCDIYLAEDEKSNLFGDYWVLNAGYMDNIPVKHYPLQKFAQVVKLLEGKIKFVQVGAGVHHMPVEGCIDMVNKTTLRQLFSIIYNSKGTLSPISSTVHLSTMQAPYGRPRPAVVIAGGRENSQLFCYNNTFPVSNVGFYNCCKVNGCLQRNECRSKVVLKDGTWAPQCMCDIAPERVAELILYCDKYYR